MSSEPTKAIADQTRRLQHELDGLWSAADLIVLARTLALVHPETQLGFLERIGELGDLIEEALVQVEDAAGELSDAVAAMR